MEVATLLPVNVTAKTVGRETNAIKWINVAVKIVEATENVTHSMDFANATTVFQVTAAN